MLGSKRAAASAIIGSDAAARNSSTLSKSGLRDEPSGATRPTVANTNGRCRLVFGFFPGNKAPDAATGRSRLMCAFMPSNRSPVAVTVLFLAASNAVSHESGTADRLPEAQLL